MRPPERAGRARGARSRVQLWHTRRLARTTSSYLNERLTKPNFVVFFLSFFFSVSVFELARDALLLVHDEKWETERRRKKYGPDTARARTDKRE